MNNVEATATRDRLTSMLVRYKTTTRSFADCFLLRTNRTCSICHHGQQKVSYYVEHDARIYVALCAGCYTSGLMLRIAKDIPAEILQLNFGDITPQILYTIVLLIVQELFE